MKDAIRCFCLLSVLAIQGCAPPYSTTEVDFLASKFDNYTSDRRLEKWREFAHDCVEKEIDKILVVSDSNSKSERVIVRIGDSAYRGQLHANQIRWDAGFGARAGHGESDPSIEEEITNWAQNESAILQEHGLVGYEKLGPGDIKLYLEPNIVLLVVFTNSPSDVVKTYDEYSKAGHDPRGDAIKKIADLLYIRTERR